MLEEITPQFERDSQSPSSRKQTKQIDYQTPKKMIKKEQLDVQDFHSPQSNNENLFTPKYQVHNYEQKIANQSTQAQLQSPFCGSPSLNWRTPKSLLKTNPFQAFSEQSTPNDRNQDSSKSMHTPISPYADRYIPFRQEVLSRNLFQVSNSDRKMILPFDTSEVLGSSNLSSNLYQTMEDEDKQQKNKLYQSLLQETLLDIKGEQQEGEQLQQQQSVLTFKNKTTDCDNQKYVSSSSKKQSVVKVRKIEKTPFKVLDAPGLQDDFYQDVLHWSKTNLIGVGLSQSIYLYNYADGKVMRITEQSQGEQNYYTSLQWNTTGSLLAVGTLDGTMLLWDAGRQCDLSKTALCQKRIATISWANNNVFACGSKDKSILIGDVRTPNMVVTRWSNAHQQEVCGVTFSDNEMQLASGGNDNKVHVWAINGGIQTLPSSQNETNKNFLQMTIKEHKAAVRALSWNPHVSGMLATGGGSADKTIKITSTLNNTTLHNIEVDSQVCKIKFSRNSNEFVSTHGYEKNQVMVWQYQQQPKRISCLEGHTSRVLYMSFSPDDSQVVTGSGDETLKFWNVFPKQTHTTQSEVLKISDFR